MSVVLHIGIHKTGTTSLQFWLRDHPDQLDAAGLRFPRGWLRLNTHFELPLTLMRLDRMLVGRTRGDEWRDARWREMVLEQVKVDLLNHPEQTTILSAEDLCLMRYDDEVASLKAVVGDAHVVVCLRDPDDWRASMAAHYSKAHMPGLSTEPDAYNYLEPDTWRVQYEQLVALWRRHFTRLTLMNYDLMLAEHGSVLPSMLQLLGLPPGGISHCEYWLNGRADAVVRAEGNRRTNGLMFGMEPTAPSGTPPLASGTSGRYGGG